MSTTESGSYLWFYLQNRPRIRHIALGGEAKTSLIKACYEYDDLSVSLVCFGCTVWQKKVLDCFFICINTDSLLLIPAFLCELWMLPGMEAKLNGFKRAVIPKVWEAYNGC